MKVFARLLQKAAESRGSASGRAPQGAEHPIAKKRRRGSKGGPSPGPPPFAGGPPPANPSEYKKTPPPNRAAGFALAFIL